MKKRWRRILAATVIGAGILCGILQTPFAGNIMEVEAAENIASGVSGQITWVINSEGHLTVTGTGDVPRKIFLRYPPWYEYREEIVTAEMDVTGMTDASDLFYECSKLQTIDLSGFDTSNVTDMSNMFMCCESLETIDLSGFDTRNVQSMYEMFVNCYSLKTLDLSGFDTGNVQNMRELFLNCYSLKTLDLSGFDTSKILDMREMFCGCASLETLDLSGFDTRNVQSMYGMFANCYSLKTLDLSGFDTSGVSIMSNMFQGCASLQTIDLSGFDMSNVIGMSYMFEGCEKLTQIFSPSSCTENIKLPISLKTDQWYMPDGTEIDYLPIGLSESVLLTRKSSLAIESFVVNQKKEVELNGEKGYFSGILKLQSGSEASPEFMNSIVKSIQWSSSDASIVNASTINCDGVSSYDGLSSELVIGFKPQKAGKVIITGTLNGRTVSCEVTVIDNRAQIKELQMQKKLYRKRKDNIYIEAELYLTEEGEHSEKILLEYVDSVIFTSSDTSIAEVLNKTYTFSEDYRKATIKVVLKNKAVGVTEIEGKVGKFSCKTKLHILDNTYAAELDGWPIINAGISFGYGKEYKIPWSQYKKLYGYSPIGKILSFNSWGGSCFGMSLTSAANYVGKINLESYFTNEQNNIYLSEYGYTGKKTFMSEEIYDVIDNKNIIDIIEKAHISQYSSEFANTEIGKHDSDYSELLEIVTSGDEKILVTMEVLFSGHAVLIDDYEGRTEDGWYVFSLYDSNYPAGGENLSTPYDDYESYSALWLNPENGDWVYRCFENESWVNKMSNIYRDICGHSYIRFYNVNQLSSSFFREPLTFSAGKFIVFNETAESFNISNPKGVIIAFEENKLIELAEKYDYNVSFDGGDAQVKYMNFSDEIFEIEIGKGEISIYDSQKNVANKISCDGECKVLWESNIDIEAAEDVSLVINNVVIEGGKLEETEIKLELEKGEQLMLINEENDVVLKSTMEQEVKIEVFDENGKILADYKEVLKGGTPTKIRKDVTKIFIDVYNDWYTPYVQYVYDNNLMTGIKGTTEFQSNANITKSQVAQVLYNMEGQPVVKDKKAFTDLKDVYEVEWYANAVAWAYNTGVVTGDLNTKKFSPNANVTREQLALMLYRYAQFKKYSTIQSSDLSGLKNAENVSNWASDGVRWAVGVNLISGIEKNGIKDLAPQGNATRAQVAAILQRFCENVIK